MGDTAAPDLPPPASVAPSLIAQILAIIAITFLAAVDAVYVPDDNIHREIYLLIGALGVPRTAIDALQFIRALRK